MQPPLAEMRPESNGAEVSFFFSSRRLHTSLVGDWSSDVCSSDLVAGRLRDRGGTGNLAAGEGRIGDVVDLVLGVRLDAGDVGPQLGVDLRGAPLNERIEVGPQEKIGR